LAGTVEQLTVEIEDKQKRLAGPEKEQLDVRDIEM